MRSLVAAVCLILTLVLLAAPVHAQKEFEIYYQMQAMNDALGVSCTYCHVATGDARWDFKADGNPKKAVAKKMIDMTADINARIYLATGNQAARDGGKAVSCQSCHRGVTVPLPIATIVERAVETEGPEAAVAQYRALRARFYERDVYDFTEQELLRLARHYVTAQPDAALALARMNLEWRPQSAASYVVMAFAYTRKLDDKAAIPLLRKALELDPDNGAARGYLLKLEEFQTLKEGQ
jgi:tetratricopeptide (TPR) repeat protein